MFLGTRVGVEKSDTGSRSIQESSCGTTTLGMKETFGETLAVPSVKLQSSLALSTSQTSQLTTAHTPALSMHAIVPR